MTSGLLVDTNILIWLKLGDDRVPEHVLDRILTGAETLHVSVVSAWEYGHKRLLWPGELAMSFDELVSSLPHEQLGLDFAVRRYAEDLPLIHRDPFDRMLIAQALHHGLTLVASDEKIARYPVSIFW